MTTIPRFLPSLRRPAGPSASRTRRRRVRRPERTRRRLARILDANADVPLVSRREVRGERRVRAVSHRMRGLTDGSQLKALERRIDAIKVACYLDQLRARAAFERRRGDLASARELETAVDLIVHPLAPASAIELGPVAE